MANNVTIPDWLVDPNDFNRLTTNGFDFEFKSDSNVPVNLEDLSIYVSLTTTKPSRSLITTSVDNVTTLNQSSEGIKIDFISGSDFGGKKSLTTSFTDFKNETTYEENLGISSIDISFNASYAPMVNIHFVDVRGASIFQNGAQSKYDVFFNLPYPIFNLTVKGYYGKAVTYCLHMRKFTAKFNSQTGNFEIVGEFIGYTYAILTDMLLGLMKAVPYTQQGKSIFENIKNETIEPGRIKTIKEFIDDLSKINDIGNLVKNTEAGQQLATIPKAKESLNNIQNIVNNFKYSLLSESNTIYPLNSDEISDVNNISYIIKKQEKNTGFNLNNKTLNDYDNLVKKEIDQYNSFVGTSDLKIKYDNYKSTAIKKDNVKQNSLHFEVGLTYEELNEIKKINKDLATNQEVSVFNFKNIIIDLNEKNKQINESEKNIKKELSVQISKEVKETIGFDLSIRNVFEILTTHVDVLVKTIYEISRSAENNQSRDSVLKNKNFDIKNNETSKIYPWPEYRVENTEGVLVETYLGEIPDSVTKVPEVRFIEDLYNQLIRQYIEEQEQEINNEINNKIWVASNPIELETINTLKIKPYTKSVLPKDVVLESVIRSMTYLGYSNKSLTNEEIKNMAENEAYFIIKNQNINKQTKLNLVDNFNYKDVKGRTTYYYQTDLTDNPVLSSDTNNYYYSYIYPLNFNNSLSVLPLNGIQNIDWDWNTALNNSSQTSLYRKSLPGNTIYNEQYLFLTNYDSSNTSKPRDGGIYCKITNTITPKETFYYVEPSVNETTIPFKELNKPNIDINLFKNISKEYNFPEFKTSSIDFSEYDKDLNNMNISFMFYEENSNRSELKGFAKTY